MTPKGDRSSGVKKGIRPPRRSHFDFIPKGGVGKRVHGGPDSATSVDRFISQGGHFGGGFFLGLLETPLMRPLDLLACITMRRFGIDRPPDAELALGLDFGEREKGGLLHIPVLRCLGPCSGLHNVLRMD